MVGVKKEHKDIIEGTDYGLLGDKIKSQDQDADNAFYADDDRGGGWFCKTMHDPCQASKDAGNEVCYVLAYKINKNLQL